MRTRLQIFISFFGAIALVQVAAAAAPPGVQGAQNPPIPNAGAIAPRGPVVAGDATAYSQHVEYVRRLSVQLGVLGSGSTQSLDSLCPTRHIGINRAPLDNQVECTPF